MKKEKKKKFFQVSKKENKNKDVSFISKTLTFEIRDKKKYVSSDKLINKKSIK